MNLTEIDAEPDGDVIFPTLDPGVWKEISREDFAADAQNDAACAVRVLRKA